MILSARLTHPAEIDRANVQRALFVVLGWLKVSPDGQPAVSVDCQSPAIPGPNVDAEPEHPFGHLSYEIGLQSVRHGDAGH